MPKQNGRFFDCTFVYEVEKEQIKTNPTQAIGIDLGLDNLCAVVSTTEESFLLDEKHLKSVNQWFNKHIS